MSPFWDGVLRALPPFLVVVGWVFVYKLQALQARKKFLREEVEKARGAIEKLEALAIVFHTTTYSAASNFAIVSGITDIERRCSLFPKIIGAQTARRFPPRAPRLTTVEPSLFVAIRQAITLKHFDDPKDAPLSPTDLQLAEIASACNAAIAALDTVLLVGLD